MASMDSTRAIVFGSGGLLGQALVAGLPGAGFELVAAPRGRAEVDISNVGQVGELVDRLRPDVIFNAAAYTDVDGAEDNQAAAFAANALGPEVLARAAARTGARLVHYSTDFVFDGERETPYDEEVPPVPALGLRARQAGRRAAGAGGLQAQLRDAGGLPVRPGRAQFPFHLAAPAARRRSDPRRQRASGLAHLGRPGGAPVATAGGHRTLRHLPRHRAGRDLLGGLRPLPGRGGRDPATRAWRRSRSPRCG